MEIVYSSALSFSWRRSSTVSFSIITETAQRQGLVMRLCGSGTGTMRPDACRVCFWHRLDAREPLKASVV